MSKWKAAESPHKHGFFMIFFPLKIIHVKELFPLKPFLGSNKNLQVNCNFKCQFAMFKNKWKPLLLHSKHCFKETENIQ